MALIWATTSIYRLGRDGFYFFFIENPLSNVVFCTFSMTSKNTDFHFFSEILAQIMKFSTFLCVDRMTGHLAMETMIVSEKFNW